MASRTAMLLLLLAAVVAVHAQTDSSGQMTEGGNSVYVVPVFQSETIKGSFNALNPTPDIPSVLYPGSPMGTRPFYAQVGMGIVPPSFVETDAATKGPVGAEEALKCPDGARRVTNSAEQSVCVLEPQRGTPMWKQPPVNYGTPDPVMQPGFNPLLPPAQMPFGSATETNPSLAIIPPSFIQGPEHFADGVVHQTTTGGAQQFTTRQRVPTSYDKLVSEHITQVFRSGSKCDNCEYL